MFFKYFNSKKNNLNDQSLTFYKEIVNHSNNFIKYNNSDENINFNDVFEIFSIVIIFYLKKLKDKNTPDSKIISQEIIDSFVRDLDQHFREQGIGDMSIGKYVKKYVKKFYYRIKIIDPILNNNEKTVFIKFLKSLKIIKDSHILEISEDLLDIYNKLKHDKTRILS